VTGVSSVWSFVNQKVVSQFPEFTVTIFNAFGFVGIAEFLRKQVKFLLESLATRLFKS